MSEIQYYDSAVRKNQLVNGMKELYQYRDLIWQMTVRNITVRYKRSALGAIWTLLDPLLTMLVMAFVFSALLQKQVPHFIVYLLSGLTVWNYFQQSTNAAIHEFASSERLVSKIYLPQATFVIVSISTGMVNFLLSLVALLVIAIFSGTPISIPYTLTLVVPLIVLTIFNLGIGLLLSPLNALFSDTENIYNILLRLLIYCSAIFYQVEILPHWLQAIINLNPVYQFINIFRHPIYSGQPIPMDSFLYVSAWALAMLVIGWIVFTRLSEKVAAEL